MNIGKPKNLTSYVKYMLLNIYITYKQTYVRASLKVLAIPRAREKLGLDTWTNPSFTGNPVNTRCGPLRKEYMYIYIICES